MTDALADVADAPFYLYVHNTEPHNPCDHAPPHTDGFPDGECRIISCCGGESKKRLYAHHVTVLVSREPAREHRGRLRADVLINAADKAVLPVSGVPRLQKKTPEISTFRDVVRYYDNEGRNYSETAAPRPRGGMQMFKFANVILFACALVVATPTAAVAEDPVYLASSFETLYRVTDGGGTESWEFPGTKIRGMYSNATTGEVLVLGDVGGGGTPTTVYTMNNAASGTPTLTEFAQLTHQYASLARIGNTYYGYGSSGMYTIEFDTTDAPVETYVGTSGLSGVGGLAYDASTDNLYMVAYGSDALYTLDPATAAATFVGGLGAASGGLGAEWFGGELFIATQNLSSGFVEIGQVDAQTGLYANMFTLSSGATNQATAMAVIPEPATVSMMLAGLALAIRRR